MNLRRLFYKSRQIPVVPVTSMVPPANFMQVMNPVYMILQVRPLVDYGLAELSKTNPRHAITETAIIAYLMGMGFEFRTARAIAESWEENETFICEGDRSWPRLLSSDTPETAETE